MPVEQPPEGPLDAVGPTYVFVIIGKIVAHFRFSDERQIISGYFDVFMEPTQPRTQVMKG